MANIDKMVFRPVMLRDGSPYNGAYREMSAGENLFMGDLVEPTATGVARGSGAINACARAETGDPIAGIVVGWEYQPDTLGDLYCRSGNVVYIADTRDLVLEAQTVSNGLAVTDVGLNVNFVVTSAGSTTTGESGFEIDDATEATTNTLDLRIHSLVNRDDNDIALANMKVLVTVNRNWTTDQIAGV